MRIEGSNRAASSVIAFLCVAMAGVALIPYASAASPATWHVTLGTASDDMARMGMAFYPNSLTVHAGDQVVFTDLLIEPHTVTVGASGPLNPFDFFAPLNLTSPGNGALSTVVHDGKIVNSGILVLGGPFGNAFTLTADVASGTYTFQCALHPRMTGTLIVVPASQKLPKTDAQYQKLGHARMMVDLAHANDIMEASAEAAATASDIGGTGIEVAVGGGDGVSTVMRFLPGDLTIHVGDTVTFVNRDPFTPHTVTFGEEPPGGDLGLLAPANRSFPFDTSTSFDGSFSLNSGFLLSFLPWGNTFSVTFTHEGAYPYICGLHDLMGMTGTITVEA